jgi:MazG family protein
MKKADIQKLVDLMARLRGPDGCPWDKEQTRETLKPMLIEEAYEVLDALDSDDPNELREELGDLLFQVVFHAQIGAERNEFTLAEVIDRLYEKMVRRHPHVFGDAPYRTSADVLKNWEDIKSAEKQASGEKPKAEKRSILEGSPKQLPPLTEAFQLTAKAARVGFDWSKIEEIFEKLQEELGELRAALAGQDQKQIADEIGDLLFVVTNIARFLNIDPETALRRSNKKFVVRFQYIEEELRKRGKDLKDSTLEEMEALWQEAKNKV